jgi:four helix bundle protein
MLVEDSMLKPEQLTLKGETVQKRQYDLEDRLLDYSAMIVRLTEKLPDTRAGNHVAGHLLRSGTSSLPNHGEAEAAESRSDFIHKLSICHKELREARRWLRLIQRVPLLKESDELSKVLKETDELVRIFAASIKTAKSNDPHDKE